MEASLSTTALLRIMYSENCQKVQGKLGRVIEETLQPDSHDKSHGWISSLLYIDQRVLNMRLW